MSERKINFKTIEIVVFATIWFVLFSIPYLQEQSGTTLYWDKMKEEWIRTATYFSIFLLNITLLVPRLLFPKKYVRYILTVLLSIVLFNAGSVWLMNSLKTEEPQSMPRMELGPGMPPMELGDKMPAPIGYKQPLPDMKPSNAIQFANGIIISLLVVGASIAFKMMSKWLSEENLRKDVEKVQLKTELAFLRHQVSPHFFMNTLNNIHALVDINTETAKDAIIKLSTLMRYLLYETNQGKTTLKLELEFIESYIELMRLRFTDKVEVVFIKPTIIPKVEVPPMLFISFLENAFKHGISYQQNSYIHFRLSVTDNLIQTNITNSKHINNQRPKTQFSGIGLTNIKKTLELHYDKDYSLKILDNESSFEVQLTFPITVTGRVKDIESKI